MNFGQKIRGLASDMNLGKQTRAWTLALVLFLGIGGTAYGIVHHAGAMSKVENAVVGTYQKIEDGAVDGYMSVQNFFTGESAEHTK